MSGVDFSRNAAAYDDRHGAAIDDTLAGRLIDAAALARGSIVLDVGAGTGRVAIPLAAHGCRVVAMDSSAAMLERLSEKTRSALRPLPSLCPLCGVAQAPPFYAAAFDAVVIARLLYLLEDWPQALDEAARVLGRGGRLLHEWGNGEAGEPWVAIRDKARELFEAAGVSKPFHPGARTEDEIDRHLRARGFAPSGSVSVASGASSTVGQFLDRIEAAECSYTWRVPDAVQRACLPRLRAWAETRFGLDLVFPAPREIRWTIYTSR